MFVLLCYQPLSPWLEGLDPVQLFTSVPVPELPFQMACPVLAAREPLQPPSGTQDRTSC